MAKGPQRGKDVFAAVPRRAYPVIAWLDERGDVQSAPAGPELTVSGLQSATQCRKGVKYQHRRHYEGYYWCAGTRDLLWYESMTEFTALMALDHTRVLTHAVSQPMCLLLPDGSRHFPDFFLMDSDGTQTLVDVRPESLRDARALAQFAATEEVCQLIGWEYLLIGELDLLVRTNLECIAGWRHNRYQPEASLAAEVTGFVGESREFQAVAAFLAQGVPGRRIHHLYNMLWNRLLLFDVAAPLTGRTLLIGAS